MNISILKNVFNFVFKETVGSEKQNGSNDMASNSGEASGSSNQQLKPTDLYNYLSNEMQVSVFCASILKINSSIFHIYYICMARVRNPHTKHNYSIYIHCMKAFQIQFNKVPALILLKRIHSPNPYFHENHPKEKFSTAAVFTLFLNKYFK